MAAHVQDVIMLFGDSITQGAWAPNHNGFGQRLAHAYARKFDVLNRGLSGYNTEWGIPVFEQCFAKKEERQHVPAVKLLVIWFGANDACIKPSPQHIPLEKFITNLKYIINLVKSPESAWYSSDTEIILMTPPPVNTLQRSADLGSRDPPQALDRLFRTTEAYANGVKEAALGAKDIAVVDIWTDLWKAAGESESALSEFLLDGLHLNEKGYDIVYDALIKTILEKYPGLHYDNLKSVFLPWAEIPWDDVGDSLERRSA